MAYKNIDFNSILTILRNDHTIIIRLNVVTFALLNLLQLEFFKFFINIK